VVRCNRRYQIAFFRPPLCRRITSTGVSGGWARATSKATCYALVNRCYYCLFCRYYYFFFFFHTFSTSATLVATRPSCSYRRDSCTIVSPYDIVREAVTVCVRGQGFVVCARACYVQIDTAYDWYDWQSARINCFIFLHSHRKRTLRICPHTYRLTKPSSIESIYKQRNVSL
jgi:hypothetical protein